MQPAHHHAMAIEKKGKSANPSPLFLDLAIPVSISPPSIKLDSHTHIFGA